MTFDPRNNFRFASTSVVGVAFVLLVAAATFGQISYQTTIEKWRAEHEAKLRADNGWLTVAGLFWLKEGENTVGISANNDIVLPAGAYPADVGVFELRGGRTTFRARNNARVTSRGRLIKVLELKSDAAERHDSINIGDVTLGIIKRGTRFGVRLWDKNSRYRREFTGLHWYPVKDAYRVTARFIPFGQPKEINITNVIGDTEKMQVPGVIIFQLNGHEYQIQPLIEKGEEKLFIIFRDLTSGKSTYPAGRFLYADAPRNGRVTLDFNQAYNPPCAFTAFATCPLPPKENRLNVAIEAGEQTYHVKH